MATMQPMSRIISVSDLPWEERQPGVKRKLLWEDPATQRRAIMNRIEPSAQFPRHRHVGDELVFVIEGALSDEFGTITAHNAVHRCEVAEMLNPPPHDFRAGAVAPTAPHKPAELGDPGDGVA